jgi:protein-S-isoprenylcysteine O-methyltransferase Ste14
MTATLRNNPDSAGSALPPSSAAASAKRSSAAASAKRDAPGVIAPPPLIYLGGLAAGFALEALLPSAPVPQAVTWPVGGAMVVGGLALARSFFRALHGANTPVSPYSPSTALVTTGPYRLSRNPGYLGMALGYVGVAILSGAYWALVPLVPTLLLIDRGVIRREEHHLERRFGEEYLRYKARTRRWI